MTDPQDTFRRFEGADSPLDDGAAAFDHNLRLVLCGIVIGCAIGLLAMSIFVTN